MEERCQCSMCLREMAAEELVEFDGELLCHSCLEEETTTCDRCGERIWRDDAECDSDYTLCSDCYERYYDRCECCGRIVHQDEAYTYGDDVYGGTGGLYFVMGNNPMCIYHFPSFGIYVYASTEAILLKALHRLTFLPGKQEKVHIFCGDILRIDSKGRITQSTFDDSKIVPSYNSAWNYWPGYSCFQEREDTYLSDLKAVASCYGLYPEDVDELLRDGVSV